MREGLEGSAKLAAIREDNLKRREQERKNANTADTVVDRRFGVAQPAVEAGDLKGETLDEKLDRSLKTGEAIILSSEQSAELKERIRNEDEKRIEKIRKDIGGVGGDETAATSPWEPEGEGPRFGGSAAQN